MGLKKIIILFDNYFSLCFLWKAALSTIMSVFNTNIITITVSTAYMMYPSFESCSAYIIDAAANKISIP